ncbi:hypothetical protein IWW38_004980 [Coemansia aciculifera]|uniref:Uncharacterized protein n=1 Tax=Coemansia aciculifera TaxID=417176 RepID=A0ACC1LXE8_9FUNG|nr:hypothetical protein IWW38_004980 [Coemansia aciculifera]
MNAFISKFEPQRRRQMQNKLGRKTGNNASTGYPLSAAAKEYTQDLDDDIADFIVDDDDAVAATENPPDVNASAYDTDDSARPRFSRKGPRGVMALMPDEFSMFDLPTSFKAYVQYLVHWICNDHKKPVVNDTSAQYFFQAYIAVARVIDSVEQSVVASSAWVEPFRTSLHSYPDYAWAPIPGIPGCDACHFHSNRTATFSVTLSGTPYNRAILAPPKPGEVLSQDSAAELNKDDEDESVGHSEVVTIGDDSDSDDVDLTEEGNNKPVDYNLGRTCKMRSEICHQLHHYFYHLAHTVEIRLGTLDYASKSPSTSSGRSWEDVVPDDLVEMLDAQGEIDDLFRQFKDFISLAKSGFTS